ncbi:hypothetical protein F5B17DRAFT_359579 [Nemania serpens]|nr:hypothetical protein F5B17DRAFT_359579 [Nemania serpens]
MGSDTALARIFDRLKRFGPRLGDTKDPSVAMQCQITTAKKYPHKCESRARCSLRDLERHLKARRVIFFFHHYYLAILGDAVLTFSLPPHPVVLSPPFFLNNNYNLSIGNRFSDYLSKLTRNISAIVHAIAAQAIYCYYLFLLNS